MRGVGGGIGPVNMTQDRVVLFRRSEKLQNEVPRIFRFLLPRILLRIFPDFF